MDRTGHVTSGMLNQYRRQARFAAELGLGWFGAMDELLGAGRARAKSGGSGTKTKPLARTPGSCARRSTADARAEPQASLTRTLRRR
jgi:hypothetical protein